MALDMNPRTCIITRTEHSPDEMIRFVKGPENQVVPDLKRNLPGRGVWVVNDFKSVEMAVSKGLFARGFKDKVQADNALPGLVGDLLTQTALQALAMAKKAGLVVTGQAKAEALVRSGEAGLLLQASNASADGIKKLASAVKAQQMYTEQETIVFKVFSSDELDKALGGINTMHVALHKGGATQKLVKMTTRLMNYKEPVV